MNDLLTVEEYSRKLGGVSAKEHLSDEEFAHMVGFYREKVWDVFMAESNGYNAEPYIEQARKLINNLEL